MPSTNPNPLQRGPEQPIYQQIADHLRGVIISGEYRPGDRLPSMGDLARRFSVSHQTVSNAVRVLRGEKLVAPQGRKGIFVREDALTSESGQQLARNLSGAPDADHIEILSAQIETCPAYVGDLLGFDADSGAARVCRREALASRHGKPYRLSVSWAAPWAYGAAPELTEPRLINGLRAIWRATGRKATQEKWYFMARTADEREARSLEVETGDVVLAGTSVWTDSDGAPIEYREFVVPAGYVVSGVSEVTLD